MRDLNGTDGDFVRTLAFKNDTNRLLRDLNEKWISTFETFVALQRAANAHSNANQILLDALDNQMIEYQEDAYSRMEADAIPQLIALRTGDASFFQDDHQAARFSDFLAHQYFRTKAMRDRIRATFHASTEKSRFDRTWPILRYVFATNVGYSIFVNRKSMQLQVLNAAPGMEFITADQPAVNTYGAFVTPDTPAKELELYYPVSPTHAAIISGHAVYKQVHDRALEPFRMNYLNQTIEFVAHEQLFAKSEATLRTVSSEFCKRETQSR
jgi:hypothetical protein